LNLIRDCLDKRLVDRNERLMGRVDGIVFKLEPKRQPRVTFIELGMVTRADRFGGFPGRIVAKLTRRSQIADRYQIPWRKIRVGINEVRADVIAEETPALAWELWLRKHVIGRIPGAHGK